jgi:hypothetical protein
MMGFAASPPPALAMRSIDGQAAEGGAASRREAHKP